MVLILLAVEEEVLDLQVEAVDIMDIDQMVLLEEIQDLVVMLVIL